MKTRLLFFVWLAVFWLVFFEVGRVVFLFYQYDQTASLALKEWAVPLWLGLRMDAAMTGYWLLLPGLILAASAWLNNRAVGRSLAVVMYTLLTISILIIVADLELYKHWGFRINNTPLMYMSREGAGSVNTWVLAGLFAVLVGYGVLFGWAYHRWLHKRVAGFTPMRPHQAAGFVLLTAALIIPIRSSFSVAPLNTGVVYFHKTKAFPNHAGINPVWNFFKSLTMDDAHRYTNSLYPQEEAQRLLRQMTFAAQDTARVLTLQRPNIVLIILESFTAKVIKPLGGQEGITPQLNVLCNEGLLFDHFYASGGRTDKGLVSILSGYPAQPRTSIIKFPQKTQSLPSLPRALQALGYSTSFLYGGDIGFANMESYLNNLGYQTITDGDDFDRALDDSKWGVPDHYVFERLLRECDTARAPFFKAVLTLSSHEPFEVPMEHVFPGTDESALFLNSCYYTDQSLGKFIYEAKKTAWWDSTLVIVTADHGHRFPHSQELKDKERFKIPMLWLGGALHRSGVVTALGGHADIANTLLAQVHRVDTTFMFSKDLLARDVAPFAVYVFHNGYGFLTPQGDDVFDFDLKGYLRQTADSAAIKFGKAYMQMLFHDFNSR